jgi:hypothetical protein
VTHTSHEMQGEVVNELHAEWLSRMSYFHGVDKKTGKKWQVDNEFKLELALSMKIEMVAPMEKIFKEESPIDKLFVIQRGGGCTICMVAVVSTLAPTIYEVKTRFQSLLSHASNCMYRYRAGWWVAAAGCCTKG